MHNDKGGSQTIAAFIIILNRIKVRKRESGRITAFCLVGGGRTRMAISYFKSI